MLAYIKNSFKIKYFLLFAFLLFFSQNVLFATTLKTLTVNKETTKVNLFEYIEILEDKNNILTIDDVTKQEYKEKFKPTSIIGNTFGLTKSAFWVRFSLKIDKNLSDSIYIELAYPLMDYATLYIPTKDQKFTAKETGELILNSKKEINYRNHLFIIPKTSNENIIYYMHVHTQGSTQIPLTLYTSSTLIEHIDKNNFIFGGYYGNMVMLMLAAFIAYLRIRDKLFLTYSIYLFSYLLFQLSMNGFSTQYFSPLPLEYANKATLFTLAFVVFGGALFSGHFLQIWSGKYPKVKLLYYLLVLSSFSGVLISYIIDHSLGVQISVIAGSLLPPVVLIGAINSLYNGYKPALYFLIAWGVFLFGIFVSGLVFLGFISHTFVTAYSMQIGSTLELLLLGYALIDRINILYDEKEKATKEANRYLNQINEGLESLVLERTKELNHKNELLSELAIKDSMTNMLNHNASIERLNSMKSTAIRHKYNLAVIMIDIDLFKAINDRYGHPAGDQVIIEIAKVINNNIRPSDSAGRYGGEEFIIILHDIDEANAVELAERIRVDIESLKISAIDNQPVSASFGVSALDSSNPYCDIIKQADEALYAAKDSGRNRVEKYSA